MISTVTYLLNWYQTQIGRAWDNMTPMQYLYLLIFIALCGYALMKSTGK